MPQHLELKVAWLRLQPRVFAWDRNPGDPDSGVTSHASAAQLHGLGDIPAPSAEIIVPRRRTTTDPLVRLRTASLEQSGRHCCGWPARHHSHPHHRRSAARRDRWGPRWRRHRRRRTPRPPQRQRLGRCRSALHSQFSLSDSATGQKLIEHLVSQSGEHLRATEIAQANQEGFETAVQLLAQHPELAAPALARYRETIKTLQGAMPQRALPDISPALVYSLRDARISNPAVETLRQKIQEIQPRLHKALQQQRILPNDALLESIQQAAAASLPADNLKSFSEALATASAAAAQKHWDRSTTRSEGRTGLPTASAVNSEDPANDDHDPE